VQAERQNSHRAGRRFAQSQVPKSILAPTKFSRRDPDLIGRLTTVAHPCKTGKQSPIGRRDYRGNAGRGVRCRAAKADVSTADLEGPRRPIVAGSGRSTVEDLRRSVVSPRRSVVSPRRSMVIGPRGSTLA
jgi:hypothetical protein